MTTGRINQVTIVAPGPACNEASAGAQGSVVKWEGCVSPGRRLRRDWRRGSASAAIRLPQPNSPGRRPPKSASNRIVDRTSAWPPQEGAARRRSRRRDGYRYAGVPPNVSFNIDSQRLTIHETQRCGPVSNRRGRLHDTPPRARRVAQTADGGGAVGICAKGSPWSRQRVGSIGRPGFINRRYECGTVREGGRRFSSDLWPGVSYRGPSSASGFDWSNAPKQEVRWTHLRAAARVALDQSGPTARFGAASPDPHRRVIGARRRSNGPSFAQAAIS
jgi:hypothetical protein